MPFQASWVQEALARRLEELRTGKNWSTREVAAKLKWPQSKVSRIENALNKIDPLDVIKLGQLYELGEAEIDRLCEMARDSRTDMWWQRFEPWLPESYYKLIGYENEAVSLRSSQPSVVPGLLQTRDYATALIANSPIMYDEDTADALIDVRMQRQRRIDETEPLKLDVVIAESVLYWEYGGPDVLKAQLTHLREQAERPHVTIRVVPYTNAIILLPLEIYQFKGSEFAAVAFSETLWTNALHEGPQETKRALRMFERHAAMALSPDDSQRLIEQRITESGR